VEFCGTPETKTCSIFCYHGLFSVCWELHRKVECCINALLLKLHTQLMYPAGLSFTYQQLPTCHQLMQTVNNLISV